MSYNFFMLDVSDKISLRFPVTKNKFHLLLTAVG